MSLVPGVLDVVGSPWRQGGQEVENRRLAGSPRQSGLEIQILNSLTLGDC